MCTRMYTYIPVHFYNQVQTIQTSSAGHFRQHIYQYFRSLNEVVSSDDQAPLPFGKGELSNTHYSGNDVEIVNLLQPDCFHEAKSTCLILVGLVLTNQIRGETYYYKPGVFQLSGST